MTAHTDLEAETHGEPRPVAPAPLWGDAYAVVWPRVGMPGPYRCGCNPSYGQSCSYCDGSWIK